MISIGYPCQKGRIRTFYETINVYPQQIQNEWRPWLAPSEFSIYQEWGTDAREFHGLDIGYWFLVETGVRVC